MQRNRKLVSLVLTVLMVLALLPASLAAEGTGTAAAASGDSTLPEQYIRVEPQIEGASEPVTGAIDAVDFSENNMLTSTYSSSAPYRYYASDGYDSGGTPEKAAAYYVRWGGPVADINDKYPNPATAANVQYRSGLLPMTRVSDVLMVPNLSTDQTANIPKIKQLVKDYGAVSIGMEYDSANYMNWTTHSFYMPYKAAEASNNFGHEVTVMGWDDTYPASNFKINPGRNGAFIIKNSHGTGGQQGNGYFYLSYADKCVGRLYKVTQAEDFNYTSTNTVFVAGDPDVESYDHNYQYDPYGYTNAIGFTRSSPAYYYMANVFTASSNQTLKAVMFSTRQFNVGYSVYIVKGATASTLPTVSKLPAASASGTQTYPGYHTVKLANGVSLTAGQSFAVIVRIPGNLSFPVCIEGQTYQDANETVKTERNLTTDLNQSFLSTGSDWEDLATFPASVSGNLCIKAFTVDGLTGTADGQPLVGGASSTAPSESVTVGTSETAPGSSTVPGASQTAPGESNVPGTSNTVPGNSEPATAGNDANTISSLLDSLNLPQEDTPPPTGGSSEDGFIRGVQLQRYNLYSDEGSEVLTGASLPTQYNLRDYNIFTSVKNQGGIGSCWTFAAVASAETTYMINHGLTRDGVSFKQSSAFLSNTAGSAITLTAYAPTSASAPEYWWQVISGDDSVTFTPSNTNSITFNYKPGGAETELHVYAEVAYSSGEYFYCDYYIPVTNYGTGKGTASEPFEVSTPMGLQLIDCFPGSPVNRLYFKQTKPIDLSSLSASWVPIGSNSKPFWGNYDGNNQEIQNFNPTINTLKGGENLFGIFGYVNGGTLENILINGAGIKASSSQPNAVLLAGCLAGKAQVETIKNCAASGTFDFSLTDNSSSTKTGGLVGYSNITTISHCSFTGSYSRGNGNTSSIGGLVGYADNTKISTSYATFNDAKIGNKSYSGGLIGTADMGTTVSDCYATGKFTFDSGVTGAAAGGLSGESRATTGQNAYTNCYASYQYSGYTASSGKAGTITTGYKNTKLTNCYYNKTAAGNEAIPGTFTGTPKALTAQQMAQQASFAGFNFTNTWTVANGLNGNSPVLQNPLGGSAKTELVNKDFTPRQIYVKDTAVIFGQLYPAYVWPSRLTLTPVDTTVVSNGTNGIVTGLKRGQTTVDAYYGTNKIASGINITVFDKKGDLDHNGTPDYLNSVNALLKWLAGKDTPSDDACWLLDADNSCGDNFNANIGGAPEDKPTDCLELRDLLIMQQANAGVSKNLVNHS